MALSPSSFGWTDPVWLAEAQTWIERQAGAQGWEITGPIKQPHIRPWATVLRIPTSGGTVFFKAVAPALRHEAELTQALAGWRPDCMLPTLAIDAERGWLLMPDAGQMLRAGMHTVADLQHWYKLLPLYAGVQQEMADRSTQILSLGALDRRLATLPAQYSHLLEDQQALRIGQEDGLSKAQYQRLQALAPRLADECDQLAAFGLPETLHHDDFHDGNIFITSGRYIFTDWGESGVAHPFFTLLVALRSIAYRLGLEEDSPEIIDLRDRYLQSWSMYASPQNLLAAAQLAYRLAMVCRSLTWRQVLSSVEPEQRQEYAEAVPGWLQDFLDAEESDELRAH